MIKASSLNMLGLLETKVQSSNVDNVCKCISPTFDYFGNHSDTIAARILILWNPSVLNVKVLSSTSQSVFCHISSTTMNFFATYIYAANDRGSRMELWKELLANSAAIGNNSPWIILGDFNIVKDKNEKRGGKGVDEIAMEEFNECLDTLEVFDLRYSGCFFTWSNKQNESHNILSKLDRAMVNELWLTTFPNSEAFFATAGISDHSPIAINIRPTAQTGRKPFKFFNYWTKNKEFLKVVDEAWNIQ